MLPSLTHNKQLENFNEMMTTVFLWALVSILLVQLTAAGYSFYSWKQHMVGRWYFLLILIIGIGSSVASAAVTSAAFSGVFVSIGWTMSWWVALMLGVGQTMGGLFVSLTRFPATL